MAKFGAYWSTGEYGKLVFEADSLEDAQAMIDKVEAGDLDMRDLPEVFIKNKGYELEISNLESWED